MYICESVCPFLFLFFLCVNYALYYFEVIFILLCLFSSITPSRLYISTNRCYTHITLELVRMALTFYEINSIFDFLCSIFLCYFREVSEKMMITCSQKRKTPVCLYFRYRFLLNINTYSKDVTKRSSNQRLSPTNYTRK